MKLVTFDIKKEGNMIIQLLVFVQQQVILYRIEMVPILNIDHNKQEHSYTHLHICHNVPDVSDPIEIGCTLSYKWTHCEWGITAQMFGCMHMIFPPKEYNITKALHSDIGSDAGCYAWCHH